MRELGIPMKTKEALYQARKRKEYKAMGLVDRKVWIRAEHTQKLREFVKTLNEGKV